MVVEARERALSADRGDRDARRSVEQLVRSLRETHQGAGCRRAAIPTTSTSRCSPPCADPVSDGNQSNQDLMLLRPGVPPPDPGKPEQAQNNGEAHSFAVSHNKPGCEQLRKYHTNASTMKHKAGICAVRVNLLSSRNISRRYARQ